MCVCVLVAQSCLTLWPRGQLHFAKFFHFRADVYHWRRDSSSGKEDPVHKYMKLLEKVTHFFFLFSFPFPPPPFSSLSLPSRPFSSPLPFCFLSFFKFYWGIIGIQCGRILRYIAKWLDVHISWMINTVILVIICNLIYIQN